MKFSETLSLPLLGFVVGFMFNTVSATPPPVSEYFKNPEFTQFKISPDGKTLGVLAPWNGYMNLFSFDLATRKPNILTGEKLDVTHFQWANNNRLIYSMNQGNQSSKARDFGGGLFGINKDGTDLDALILPWSASTGMGGRVHAKNHLLSLENTYPADDRYILVNNHQRRRSYPDLFLLNVQNARMKVYLRNPGRVNSYLTNNDGDVIGGMAINENVELRLMRYDKKAKGEKWEELKFFSEDYAAWDFLGYEEGEESPRLLVGANHESDKRQLYWFDWNSGAMGESLLSDPVYDISGRSLDVIGSSDVAGVLYNREKPTIHYFNKEMEKLQALLDEAIPDAFNHITSVDDAGTVAVVRSISDRHAPKYFLLYLENLKLEPLANSMAWVEKLDLVEQRPVSFETRDGWTIHGYLYLPHNYSPGNPVPFIVNPHGGPWAREEWGINWWNDLEPQFLASRGFAVLKLDFRGSTGYGKEHLKQSFKNLEKMHNDVIDGVKWAIDEGYADPKTIGIMGASWGGYATMTALVKEPDMFRFGVNIFGVVDLVEHIKTYREWDRESGYNYWLERIGDPSDEADRKMLEEWSAINAVGNIRAPVFIYHGLRDFNVDIEQSRMLVREMEKLGKPHTFIFREDEAHSAFDEENRILLYEAIDAFLKPYAPAWNTK